MSKLILSGDTSGTITLDAPAIAGLNTMTLAAATGTLSPKVLSTAVSASGTSVDFTNIPSWVTRVTVMFQGVSLSGTDNVLVQIGSGSFTTSGYVSTSGRVKDASSANTDQSTSGFICRVGLAAGTLSGAMTIMQFSSTAWVSNHSAKMNTDEVVVGGGDISFAGAIDRVRITRTGTNTFDAGSVNIMYE